MAPKDVSLPTKRQRIKPGTAFAKRLQALRLDCGYETQASFADLLGVEHERYRRWERGETEPNIDMLLKIRALTGACINKLIVGVGTDGRAEQVNLNRRQPL